MLNCWHFNIYAQDKFRAQLSWAWKKAWSKLFYKGYIWQQLAGKEFY